MSDPHPEARTLAEALEPVAWLLTNEATGETMVTQVDPGISVFDNERVEPLYLASHPPAEPGWVDITEAELFEGLLSLPDVDDGITSLSADDRTALKAMNNIARRRSAERASGEEGGA